MHFWVICFQRLQKCFGRIFTIFASKNEAAFCEIQAHSGSSLPASFKKKLWAQFHDLCVQKWSCLLWSSDAFWKFSPCKLCKKVVGTFSRFVHPKTKLFAVKFRCISKVLCLRVLQKKLWAHFHDLCVQKRSCLPWNSDAFWKFFACMIYRKSSKCNSTICASKNEAVCCEVQTQFGSFRLASFVKKVLAAFSWFVHLAVKFRRILEVLALQGLWKDLGCIITICASKNQTVCRDVQMNFGSSPPPRFTEKVLDKFSRFMCPKIKLFDLRFRRILQAFRLQDW